MTPADMLDNVLVKEVHNVKELSQVVMDYLPRYFKGLRRHTSVSNAHPTNNRVSLVVIDSIAAVFRGELGNSMAELKERNSVLLKLSQTMRFLSDKYSCCFLIVNQATTYGSNGETRAALGSKWSDCVNARIKLSKILSAREENTNSDDESSKPRQTQVMPRCLSVEFSPLHPELETTYRILPEGICVGINVD